MAINGKLKRFIFTVLFLSGLFSVQAQTSNYFLDPNSEEPRFIQRLSWSGGTYSLHCEVIIEKEEGGEYIYYMNNFTNGYYLELSLQPGNYRFRVIPYDILGKPGAGTPWEMFKVFKAVRPELYQPEEEFEYYNDRQGSKFDFHGNNIEPDARIYFVNSKGEHIVPAEIIINDNGSSVRVFFNKNQLIDGEYEVFVVNPCGLETSMSGINYKTYREKFGQMHYIAGISIMPSFHIFDDGFSSEGFFLYLSARVGVISCMFSNNYIGMEFTFSGFKKFLDSSGYKQNGLTFGFNFLFINWLPGRNAAVNYRIGIGFDLLPVMDLSYAVMGVSFMYRIYNNLCVEAGLNFPYSIFNNAGGEIQPWIGLNILF